MSDPIITFDHVVKEFKTRGRGANIARAVDDVSLTIDRGDIFGIIGYSGAGKSTLVRLINALERPTSGTVTVLGTDITSLSETKLRPIRQKIGMIFQQFNLFSTKTVAQNIAYGCPDATREQIVEAAKRAHAHKFIVQLPGGYDTVIGEDGGAFSQGQKQLLCIARVMLTDPAILLLDEATSSIDTRTELQVQAAFDELMAGRTSFVVAHRLSTIRNADCILVMRDGRIIERGTHDELLAADGFYAELYRSQFAQ